MIRLPDKWSDWAVTELIGEGAFAAVYEAERKDDPSVRAAIKVIKIPKDPSEVQELISQGFDPEQTRRYFDETVADFIREVKVMEYFKGTQNIVSIEDYQVEPGENGIGSTIYIRMELLTSLDHYLSDKTLTERDVAQIGMDMCSALSLCMSRNLIHRDIKPENIFVNDKIEGHVFYKLGDFGIARTLENRTAGLSSKGTPNYIAPEVAIGKPYDNRADIYSLGLTMYRLLNNNRLPFFPQTQLYSPSAKREAIMRRMSGEKLEPPVNASPEMAEVILKACAYDPDERYQNAEEMRQALEAVVSHNRKASPVSAEKPARPEQPDLDKTVGLMSGSVRPAQSGTDKTMKLNPGLAGPDSAGQKQKAGGTASGSKSSGKKGLKTVLILAAVLLLLGGGYWVLSGGLQSEPEPAGETVQPSATPAPTDVPASFEGWGKVTEPNVPLRVNLSDNSDIRAILSAGEFLRVYSQTDDGKGNVWCLVETGDGTIGYVRRSHVRPPKDNEDTPSPVPTETPAPTAVPTAEPTDLPTAAPVPLIILAQPADAEAALGESAVFTVTAAGDGLTCQWEYKKPDDQWKKAAWPGNASDTLKLAVANEQYYGYEFRCVITDANGASVSSDTVRIRKKTTPSPVPAAAAAPLSIISHPQSAACRVGDDVTFTVQAEGTGLSYQWESRTPDAPDWVKVSLPGNRTQALTVFVNTMEQSGTQYRCVVDDANGNRAASDPAVLTVSAYGRLTVAGWLDGNSSADNVRGYGTFDVYIDGKLAKDDAAEYSESLPAGSRYEIRDVRPTSRHKAAGTAEGSSNGTVGAEQDVLVRLKFLSVYDIKYHQNTDDTVGGMPGPQQKEYGTPLTLVANQPKREGYVFSGWSTRTNGPVMYQPGDSYPLNASATLYAVWEPEATGMLKVGGWLDGNRYADNVRGYGTFDVYIDGRLVKDDATEYSESVPAGSRYEIRDVRSTSRHKAAGTAEGSLSGTVQADQTVLVRLKFLNVYDIRYNQNTEDTVTGMPGPQQKEYGTPLTLAANQPKRAGHIFLGWALSANGQAAYQPGDSYPLDTAATLYAVWARETGTLNVGGWLDGNRYADNVRGYGTFDVYIDGKLVKDNAAEYSESIPAGSKYEIKNIRTATGHAFKGAAEGSLSGTVQADQTVLVRLKYLSVYDIRYNRNTEDTVTGMPGPQQKEYGTPLTLLSNEPKRTGYIFRGWAASANGLVVYKPGGKCDRNASQTLYAVWEPEATGMLKVGGWLDWNSSADNVRGYGTFDVYIDGRLVKDNATEYSETVPAGSRYEIKDVRPVSSHKAAGTAEGSLSGTVGADQTVLVRLKYLSVYDIKYNRNTEDAVTGMPGPQQKEYGTPLKLLSNQPKRTGYIFRGWATWRNGPVEYQPGDSYTQDTSETMYAVWERETGTLNVGSWLDGNRYADNVRGYGTFDVYIDGKLVKDDATEYSETVPAGSRYEIKNIRTAAGHAFKGAAEGDLNGTVQADQTVLVRLKYLSVYDIRYNQNTDDTVTGMPGPQQKEYGTPLTLLANEPKRTGYIFRGWAESANGLVVYKPGGKCDRNASQTLYAVWEPELTGTLKVGGWLDWNSSADNVRGYGTFDVYIDGKLVKDNATEYSETVPAGSRYEIRDPRPSSGHIFKSTAEGSLKGTVQKDQTIQVRLKFLSVYDIRYNQNTGDTVTGMPGPQQKEYGTPLTLLGKQPRRTGFIFRGWAALANGPVVFQPGDSYTLNDSVTLYAVWAPETGTLKVGGWLDWNSSADNVRGYGTFDVYIDGKLVKDNATEYSETVPAGSRYEIKDPHPASGHIFKSTAEGSLKGTVQADQTVLVRLKFLSVYDIRYNQNTEDTVTGMPGPQQKEYGNPLTLSAKQPKRTGFIFRGWAALANGPAVFQPGDSYTLNDSVTLYAVWEPDPAFSYGILDVNGWLDGNRNADSVKGYGTFDVYIDGRLVKDNATEYSETLPAGSRYEIKDPHPASGHIFKSTAEGTLKGTVQADQTVQVRLKFLSVYDIKYNRNTEDTATGMPGPQQKEYGNPLTLSAKQPKRTGYVFQGWATSANGLVVYKPGGKCTRNASQTLYAVWLPDKNAASGVLKVEGWLDGNRNADNVRGYGTFDVYIDGKLVKGNATEYSETVPAGSRYEIKDPHPASGHIFKSTAEGTLKGTVQKDQTVLVRLKFLSVYDIKYSKNTDDSVSSLPATQQKEYGNPLTLSVIQPKRTGYVFRGWATSENGLVIYKPGGKLTRNASLTLYAVWGAESAAAVKPANPDADLSGTCGKNLRWSLNQEGVLVISGNGRMDHFTDGNQPWKSCGTQIRAVVIEEGVTSIGEYAFGGYTALTIAKIPDSVTEIGSWAFGNTGLTSVHIPGKVSNIGFFALNACTKMTSISVSDENKYYSSVDGILYDKRHQTLIVCPAGRKTDAAVPKGVIRIKGHAFRDCTLISSITLPETLTAIEEGAFWNCSRLQSISIPSGIRMIEKDAFENCISLRDVYYGGTEAQWKVMKKDGNDVLGKVTVHYQSK